MASKMTKPNESPPLTPIQRTRLFGLAALIFVILASYSIARPATESLFLGAYGADALPLAWLMVGVGSLGVVTVYNRFCATTDLVRIFGVSAGISAGLLVAILLAMTAGIPKMTWVLYLWKDLYIVVLIEVFWSFANATVPQQRAKWWYGLFCVLGSLGGMAGNLGVGWLAAQSSTQTTLWAVVVLLAIGGAGGIALAKFAGVNAAPPKDPPSLTDGFKVLKNSRALWLLMALIGTTQIVITLIDYQFSVAIAENYTDADARTAIIGQVYAAIDLASLTLQLATGPIIRLVGLPMVLLAIPALLGIAVTGFVLVPKFAAISVAKVASKAFDYSLFRAAKEILYIPLSHKEKTQGKALVDMMSYRMAKGAASMMLIALVAIGRPDSALWVTIACILLWIWLTVQLNRGHRNKA
jgi:ATP/ADP translocase